MKLGQIWDYVMRRKGRFLSVSLVFVLAGGLVFNSLLKPTVEKLMIDSVTQKEDYNNSLILKIGDVPGVDGLRMSFQDNFQRATIETWPVELEAEAYVKILDEKGGIRASWTTEARGVVDNWPEDKTEETDKAEEAEKTDTETEESKETEELPEQKIKYVFAGAPESRKIELDLGFMIEVQAGRARFYSSLDGEEATSFRPATTERYIITQKGLAKMDWGAEKTEREKYQLLKRFLVRQIENYREKLDEKVLYNRLMDVEMKAKIAEAYNHLTPEDQKPYAEFMEILRKGGSPQIIYSGAKKYELGNAEPNWQNLVVVQDNEDGEIDKNMVKISTNANFSQAGIYQVTYLATDSDGNTGELIVQIEIVQLQNNDKNDQKNETEQPNEAEKPNVGQVNPDNLETPVQIQPEGPKNNPLNSSTQETWRSGMSNGSNAEDPVTPETSTQNEPNAAARVEEKIERQTTNSAEVENKENELKQKKANWGWRVLGILAGAALILGLIRFIFDHYVR